MPIVLRVRVVVDPDRCAKGQPAIGAARKHYVSCAAAARLHAGKHINIIVSRAAGPIYRDERLSTKSYPIYSALDEVAAQVNVSDLIKSRRDVRILCIRRANAVKRGPSSGKKKVAVRVHIECSSIGRVGNVNWRLPGYSGVDRAIELSGVAGEETGPKLI